MWIRVLFFLSIAIACLADGMPAGLTRSGALIQAESVSAGRKSPPVVLLLGGFKDRVSSAVIRQEMARYASLPAGKRTFRLIAIAEANPDGESLTFPPIGNAYRDDPVSHYLWRWTGLQAPDLIVIVGEDPFGFADAASRNAVAGMGTVPSRTAAAKTGLLGGLGKIEVSPARQEIARRRKRGPLDVARLLEKVYGHEMASPVYIPALALIARMRLGHLDDVRKIVEPYVTGSKDSLSGATASHLSGHLIFGELAEKTGNSAYTALVRRAADLGFEPGGSMKEAMPFHNQMSDGVFMGSPILAKAGKLTGEEKYFDMARRNFEHIASLCRRPDGLYRHSPLNEAAWGRGNAFPALGLALTLSDTPQDHPAFKELLGSFRSLMDTLARYQDPESGMWRQVIDKDGAYPEFSSTAMIARTMLLGIQKGWLDKAQFQPKVQAAWQAISVRIAIDGQLVDVCESTGKQKTLQDYLDRKAILDRDPRGGAMALLFAVEMAGLK